MDGWVGRPILALPLPYILCVAPRWCAEGRGCAAFILDGSQGAPVHPDGPGWAGPAPHLGWGAS